ncbi:MAG: sugar ABC transporter permease [Thermomicrobiales bacterium]
MAYDQTMPVSEAVPRATERAALPALPRERRGDRAFRYGMTVPTILALLLVVAFPLAFAFYVSTHDYDLTEGGIGAFVGAANYARTLGEELFAVAVRNTIVLSVSVVVIELVVALGLSLLLNRQGLKFRNVYLAILLIPLLISPIAVGLIWRLLLHPDLGAVNWMLGLLGLPKQEWLSGQTTAMPTIIGIDVWHETSLMIVIVLAGLTALPRDPIEAAAVDGANPWQAFWTVTLPLLTPVLLVAVLIRLISAMKTYDLIYILTRGGPGSATETVSYSIWKNAFTSLDMGNAAAASFLLLAAVLVLTVLLVRVMGRGGDVS